MKHRIYYIIAILLFLVACRSHRNEEKAVRLYEDGIEQETSQPDSAAYLFRRALSFTHPYSDLSVELHLRLGNLLRTHHLYNRALDEHKLALKESTPNRPTALTAKALREVGKDYLYQNHPDSALQYIQKALTLSEAAARRKAPNLWKTRSRHDRNGCRTQQPVGRIQRAERSRTRHTARIQSYRLIDRQHTDIPHIFRHR